MANKGGNFLLDNIEKIILPVAGVVCLWWLVTRVIMPPVVVELDGREFSPGEVDKYIDKQTGVIVDRLRAEPGPGKVHREELSAYISELNGPLDIDTMLWPEVPRQTGEDDDGRQYVIPEALSISDAKAGRIRAMAYLPKQDIGSDNTYETVETELGDLDLVTVEARLDVADLYSAFYDSFAGPAVRPEWRDPCLAEPVFAAVQLQRAEKLTDGGWSDWQDVPRMKIDHMRAMLEVIERVQDLPRGGMKVRLLQYASVPVMSDVLQPRPYDIASAEQYWFPPSLHKKFVSLLKEQQAAERREEMEKLREERDRQLEEARRARRESQTTTTTRESAADSDSSSVFAPRGSGRSSSRSRERVPERPQRSREDRQREREELRRQREQEKETTDDVYAQFEQMLLKNVKQLDKSSEPLLFWSHDDTVEPGKTYKYRLRLGVFNPLAGTNKLKPESESYKDKVIIWSNFADAETVEVPFRLYFFAKDVREVANTVIVEVFRYALGYWHGKEYAVEAGEVIGKVDEPEKPKEEAEQPQHRVESVLIPEKIDFRTGAIMVDAVVVDDWTGGRNLRPRNYFNMYYSYDSSSIESAPIRQRFWSADEQRLYNDILVAMRQPKQPPRPRGSTGEGLLRQDWGSPAERGREREDASSVFKPRQQ